MPRRPAVSSASVQLRRVPVPAGGDHAGGALVPAVRPVLPRCRGAACRARHSGGSRHGLPVGPAVHPGVDRRSPAPPARPGDRWFVDETYVKVAGRWVYLYRAIDQHGQVIDVLASPKRDLAAARRFFARALTRRDGRPRSPPTGRRPTRGCSTSWSPRRVTWGAVRQQPDRSRSRPAESPAATDARPETAPLRPDGLQRACVRSEPAPRPLRTRTRYRVRPPARGDLQRARRRNLKPGLNGGESVPLSPTQQRPPSHPAQPPKSAMSDESTGSVGCNASISTSREVCRVSGTHTANEPVRWGRDASTDHSHEDGAGAVDAVLFTLQDL